MFGSELLTVSIGSYLIAFIAGFLTFFATCLLPILPVYISFLGGTSLANSVHNPATGKTKKPAHLMWHSLLFIFGFLIVFSTLGLAATAAGRFLTGHRLLFEKIGGIVVILFGVSLLSIQLPIISKTFKISVPTAYMRQAGGWGALLMGLTFGFAWTPCIGPVLATILLLVSSSASPLYGASLLAVFAIGLGTPFLMTALFFEYLRPYLQKLGTWSQHLQILFGIVIIIIGMLLFSHRLDLLARWTLDIGGSFII